MENIAEPLREYYKRTLKIEMAPWASTHVDMREAYTELVLEKTENKTHGQTFVGIKDYKELFTDSMGPPEMVSKKRQPSNIPVPTQKSPLATKRKTKAPDAFASKTKTRVKDKNAPGKRILVKGNPGNGKTTLSRKMAWDWAMGLLAKFSIVFLISLKLMRPGEAIENVIIKQTPPLEAADVTAKSLKRFLGNFGNSCLLILDGYDECSVDSKSESNTITKIIKMQNLFYCNILLTSRPHITADLEPNFHVVARLLGFSKSHAQTFACKLLEDKKKRKTALKFASDHFIIDHTVHTCPMILLFICILMRNDELSDVRRGKIAPGEVYFRLMRCIYRKYAVRKGIRFNPEQFEETLRKVGKIALETLLSGNYFYNRSVIEQELGEDVFDYGFLSGHEDCGLESDETADIILSFHHTTIQEFLGAIGFLQKLNNGENIENILDILSEEPIFMIRPLFLHFCLWLLRSDKLHIEFKNKIYESIKICALKRIDLLQLDLCMIHSWYPALDLALAFERNDQFVQNFFAEILSNCKNTKFLRVGNDHPNKWVFKSMTQVLDHVRLIEIVHRENRRYVRGPPQPSMYVKPLNGILLDDSTIHIYSYSQNAVDEILPLVRTTTKRIALYCTALDHENDTGLVVNSLVGVDNLLLVGEPFRSGRLVSESFTKDCPSLTQIHIQSLELDSSVVKSLSGAIKSGKLPSLSHLSIRDCGPSLTGKLPKLFDSPWSELTLLDLYRCYLDKADFALFRSHATLFPKLVSLSLSLAVAVKQEIDETRLFSVFEADWPRLETLQIWDLSWREYAGIINCVNDRKFPQLRHLFLSQDEKRMLVHPETAGLSAGTECLPDFDLSQLTHLNLHSFIFSVEWLNAITRMRKFTELHSLDISFSVGITGNLALLLCHGFPSLHTLILKDCRLNEEDLKSLAQASSKDRLPKLKYLDLSFNNQIICKCEYLFCCSAKWNTLEVLLLQFDTDPSDEDFYALQKMVAGGGLKSLEKLHISVSEAVISSNQSWGNLSELYLSAYPSTSWAKLFTNIANAAENDVFPALRSIYIATIPAPLDPEVKEDLNILRARLKERLPGISVDILVNRLAFLVNDMCDDTEVVSADLNLAEETLLSDYLLDNFTAIVYQLVTKNDANENMYGILLHVGREFIQNTLIPKHGSRMAGFVRQLSSSYDITSALKTLLERNISVMPYPIDRNG